MNIMQQKSIKLVFVDPDNNGTQSNKFYDMTENTDGTFTAVWGRIGQSTSTKAYSMRDWDKKYNEKIKKGYRDQTALFVVASKKDFNNISDKVINKIVEDLLAFAHQTISSNYTISSEAVTQKQIDTAQDLLNDLSSIISNKPTDKKINNCLLEIYRTIPRKMKDVREHLINFQKIHNEEQLAYIQKILTQEQDLLDVMRGQVNVHAAQNEQANEQKTILDAMGMDLWLPQNNEVDQIKKLLKESKDLYHTAYCVKNRKTQDKYDKYLSNVKNKKTELFWHGSRNENWWSILSGGLVLRPTNAVITAKMYGIGSYFANLARKSIGYTSLTGSYWARGNSNRAFLSLFDVHVGNQYVIKKHGDWCKQLTWKKLQDHGDYDSVYAPGGYDLKNDEFIVYKEEQSTIKYLVELRN
jgi:poly [ADP-ribose] polymerase